MNPLIEKFWNDAGYTISHIRPGGNPTTGELEQRYLWCLMVEGTYIGLVGVSGISQMKCDYYFFNNKKYSEDEMLKIIRMKAFI